MKKTAFLIQEISNSFEVVSEQIELNLNRFLPLTNIHFIEGIGVCRIADRVYNITLTEIDLDQFFTCEYCKKPFMLLADSQQKQIESINVKSSNFCPKYCYNDMELAFCNVCFDHEPINTFKPF